MNLRMSLDLSNRSTLVQVGPSDPRLGVDATPATKSEFDRRANCYTNHVAPHLSRLGKAVVEYLCDGLSSVMVQVCEGDRTILLTAEGSHSAAAQTYKEMCARLESWAWKVFADKLAAELDEEIVLDVNPGAMQAPRQECAS